MPEKNLENFFELTTHEQECSKLNLRTTRFYAKGEVHAVALQRISSTKQRGSEQLSAQSNAILEWCYNRSITPIRAFIESAVSGWSHDRPILEKAVAATIENPLAKYLVVYSANRLTRRLDKFDEIRSILELHGKIIISVTETPEIGPGHHDFVRTRVERAEQQNFNRSDGTVAGMRRQFSRGYWPFRPPLGYSKDEKA